MARQRGQVPVDPLVTPLKERISQLGNIKLLAQNLSAQFPRRNSQAWERSIARILNGEADFITEPIDDQYRLFLGLPARPPRCEQKQRVYRVVGIRPTGSKPITMYWYYHLRGLAENRVKKLRQMGLLLEYSYIDTTWRPMPTDVDGEYVLRN